MQHPFNTKPVHFVQSMYLMVLRDCQDKRKLFHQISLNIIPCNRIRL